MLALGGGADCIVVYGPGRYADPFRQRRLARRRAVGGHAPCSTVIPTVCFDLFGVPPNSTGSSIGLPKRRRTDFLPRRFPPAVSRARRKKTAARKPRPRPRVAVSPAAIRTSCTCSARIGSTFRGGGADPSCCGHFDRERGLDAGPRLLSSTKTMRGGPRVRRELPPVGITRRESVPWRTHPGRTHAGRWAISRHRSAACCWPRTLPGPVGLTIDPLPAVVIIYDPPPPVGATD